MYTSTAYTDITLLEEYPFHGVFYKLGESVDETGDYGLDDDTEDAVDETGSYDLDDDDEEDVATEEASEETTEETDSSEEDTEETDASTEEEDSSDSSSLPSNAIIILETPCDIQQNSALFAGTSITRGYEVFFPFNPDVEELPSELKPGILFKGETYGLTVAGTVLDPITSMLGGCKVEIRGTDI